MIGVGKTDAGLVRHNNEDSIFVSTEPFGQLPNLFIVSDGMGGHNAGEIASSHGIRFFCQFASNNLETEKPEILDILIEGTIYANKNIYEISTQNNAMLGMGATFSACVIDAFNNKLFAAHVGDSRIYVVHNDHIKQISTDHTYVNEMVKAGEITEAEARVHPRRNIITRALGTEEGICVDGIVSEICVGDYILICSDGLNNMVSDNNIKEIIIGSGTVFEKCSRLIEVAKQNGGMDNISAVLIQYCKENEVTR